MFRSSCPSSFARRLSNRIPPLAAIGLVVVLGMAAQPALADVHWRSGNVSAPAPMDRAELSRAVVELGSRPGLDRVVIHFDGPLPTARRELLEANGVRLLSYLGGYAYFATLTADLRPAGVAVLPGLLAVEPVDPINKLHSDLALGITHPWTIVSEPEPATGSPPIVAVNVMFHRDFDYDGAEGLIEGYGGTVDSRIEAIHAVVAHLSRDRVLDLAADDDVMWVEPPLPALEELNDSNRARTGADIVNEAPYNLDGDGVAVMVYDGGRVANHSDLAGRMTVGQSDTSGISDHATHVACTVAGDGGNLSGMAPRAEIISYGYEQPGGLQQGFLYTDPGDLEADYSEAITTYGADLSNNSIGTNTASNGFPCSWEGNYGATGALIDEVVRGALGSPFRVVWANGNERSTGACGSTYLTTAPPACAKNHMTIGALNSNDDSVTGFTSWGPCDDGRIKPDVSAPGGQSNGDGGVSSCSSSGGYTVKCGTSMASPTAAGLSALLLQQFRESFPSRPDFRNSLLRAVMAQTAVDLVNPGPDYQTGYGSVRIQPAVDLIRQERFVEDQLTQGEVYTFSLNVMSPSDIKVTLAWDDPAGTPDVNPVLVNDLDLRIITPGQVVRYPWTLDPVNPGADAVQTQRDGTNNIEQVMIPNAGVGTYVVEIEGFNIAEGPMQSFGVASSHPPIFCFEQPTFDGLETANSGASCGEIDLTWSDGLSNCTPEGDITYNVYRNNFPLGLPHPNTLLFQGVEGTSFTDATAGPGEQYYYAVRANDSASGEDGNFVTLSATAPVEPDISPPVFGGLQTLAAGPSCGEVLLAWDPAVEICNSPVTYDIYRSTNPLFVPGPDTLIATTLGTGFIDTSVPPGVQQTYVVRAKDALGNATVDDARLDVVPTQFDLEFVRTGFEDDDEGWTVIPPNDAEAGNWEWGDPDPTSYQPGDDATEDGVNCWITGLTNPGGNGDVDNGTTTLLSAPYDLTGAVQPTVEYHRWFTNDQGGSPGDPTDTFRVDVSNDDGLNWTPFEEVGSGTPLAWVPVELPLPVAPTSEIRFRFTAADLGAGSLVEAGIDEFGLVDAEQACIQCTEPIESTLCSITIGRDGDDIRVDWSINPVDTRAVVYHVTGCDPGDHVKLGSTEEDVFVHEGALTVEEPFNYRVTFVDECGNEQAFCGATDCP